ncbi:hypothetical protein CAUPRSCDRAFT_10338 [Caulochytrium protostelioides]|nr:hypothetical protein CAUPRSCDRAFT_10338 [Caulochytrium protostelioides]
MSMAPVADRASRLAAPFSTHTALLGHDRTDVDVDVDVDAVADADANANADSNADGGHSTGVSHHMCVEDVGLEDDGMAGSDADSCDRTDDRHDNDHDHDEEGDGVIEESEDSENDDEDEDDAEGHGGGNAARIHLTPSCTRAAGATTGANGPWTALATSSVFLRERKALEIGRLWRLQRPPLWIATATASAPIAASAAFTAFTASRDARPAPS